MQMSNVKCQIRKTNWKLVFIGYLILVFILAPSASAQELGVSIDPPILQIEASPPSFIKNPISITNQSHQSVTYSIFLVPFKAKSSINGEPEFDPTLIDEYKNIFSKIQVSDENQPLTQITLAPKQKKDLSLSIRILRDEPPSDYYFSVVFISEAAGGQDKNSSIGARAGIGTNVLLSIGPKSQSLGHIEEFSSPRFVTKGPVRFKLNIANESKHYITIKGNLLIKNVFGQTVGNIDLIPANILSGSNRLIESANNSDRREPRILWDERFLLGVYRVDLALALSPDGPIFKRSIWFFAFPTEAVFGTILALVFLSAMIRRARKKSET